MSGSLPIALMANQEIQGAQQGMQHAFQGVAANVPAMISLKNLIAQQAVGRALQQATQNGKVNPQTAMGLMAANPQAALGEAQGAKEALGLGSGQVQLAHQKFGLINAQMEALGKAMIGLADGPGSVTFKKNALMRLGTLYNLPPDKMAAEVASMPQDPEKANSWLATMGNATANIGQASKNEPEGSVADVGGTLVQTTRNAGGMPGAVQQQQVGIVGTPAANTPTQTPNGVQVNRIGAVPTTLGRPGGALPMAPGASAAIGGFTPADARLPGAPAPAAGVPSPAQVAAMPPGGPAQASTPAAVGAPTVTAGPLLPGSMAVGQAGILNTEAAMYPEIQKAATAAQPLLSQIEQAQNLVDSANTGIGSPVITMLDKVGSAVGITGGLKAGSSTEELTKFLNRIATESGNAAFGQKTDYKLQLSGASNPNTTMQKPALKEMLALAKGAADMPVLMAQATQSFTKGGAQTQGLLAFQAQAAAALQPNILGIQAMSPGERQSYFESLTPSMQKTIGRQAVRYNAFAKEYGLPLLGGAQ